MTTQLPKLAAGKARSSADYLREALELWRISGRGAARVASELQTKTGTTKS